MTKKVEPVAEEAENNLSDVVANSYSNGLVDGKTQMKNTILASLKQYAGDLFLAAQDDVAKEIRKCIQHIETIQVSEPNST